MNCEGAQKKVMDFPTCITDFQCNMAAKVKLVKEEMVLCTMSLVFIAADPRRGLIMDFQPVLTFTRISLT